MNLSTAYKNNCVFEENKDAKIQVSSILTNTTRIAQASIASDLRNLLEVVFIQLKDNDSDIVHVGETFDQLVKSIVKKEPQIVIFYLLGG